MWLGLALVVWLWGLALYLAAYYFAGWYWRGQLYEVLGQDFYNAHIPGGGWEATVVPTLVFLMTLAVVGVARQPIAAAAGWLERKTRLPPRAGLVACNFALVVLAIPAVHAGVVESRSFMKDSIRRAERQAAEKRAAELRERDPFHTGEGLADPVATFAANRARLHLASDATYRYSYSSWCGNCPSGRVEWRYARRGQQIVLEQKPGDATPELRFQEVRWGERVYMIEEAGFQAFVNAINSGEEPRLIEDGNSLLRLGDETKSVEGFPPLPPPWDASLLTAALVGLTIAVAEDGTTWLDLGARHGVRVGMRLFVAESPIPAAYREAYGGRTTVLQRIEIIEVATERCRAKPVNGPAWTVEAGLDVSSRAPAESVAR